MERYLISISGCAGVNPALLPIVYKAKNDILNQYPKCEISYACVSAGIIPGLFALLDWGYEDFHRRFDEFKIPFDSWWKNPFTYTYPAMRKFLRVCITEDNLKKINGRFHIGVSRLSFKGFSFEIISNFESVDDFVRIAIASMTFSPLSLTPFRIMSRDKIKLYFDGSFINDAFTLPNFTTYYVNVFDVLSKVSLFDLIPSTDWNKCLRLIEVGKDVPYTIEQSQKNIASHGKRLLLYKMFLLGVLMVLIYTFFWITV